MKRLFGLLVLLALMTGCTVSQTQNGGGASNTNKPTDSTTTTNNSPNG